MARFSLPPILPMGAEAQLRASGIQLSRGGIGGALGSISEAIGGFFGGLGSLAGQVGSAASAVGMAAQQIRTLGNLGASSPAFNPNPSMMMIGGGGMMGAGTTGGVGIGGQQMAIGESLPSMMMQGVGSALGLCPSMYRPTTMSARPIPLLMATNPVTGSINFWRHVGRPLLFSGDLATVRRVNRVAARARRSTGRRRPR